MDLRTEHTADIQRPDTRVKHVHTSRRAVVYIVYVKEKSQLEHSSPCALKSSPVTRQSENKQSIEEKREVEYQGKTCVKGGK
eukprot:458903-Amphidinium_carterae.1